MDWIDIYMNKAIDLLSKLVGTPSLSKSEHNTRDLIVNCLHKEGIETNCIGNNVIASQMNNIAKPILILNSHHDTVKPSKEWTYDPYTLTVVGTKLTGLGSNDAGASLVSLILTFIHFYNKDLPYQLVLIASAEEEISGKNGLRRVMNEIELTPAAAIVGEPTEMKMAVAEKGLMVIDANTKGKSSHAAHYSNDNALYKAISDIEVIRNLQFSKISNLLGPVKLTVTQIEDLKSSTISTNHPLVCEGLELGLNYYGSPTLSDQVFFDCPSLKIGPGKSERSHKADEFIYKDELKNGILTYINLIENLKL